MTCLLLAGTAALSLAACGSESAPSQTSDGIVTKITKPVELQFWHSISNPVHAEVLDKLIALLFRYQRTLLLLFVKL